MNKTPLTTQRIQVWFLCTVIFGSVITLAGCSHAREDSIKEIKAAESKLKDITKIDLGNANSAISSYTKFANRFPKDTLSPQFLYKAAMLAMSTAQFKRALKLYDTIYIAYPEFKQAPDCIFVQGYIYDTFLKDTALAHAKYMEVISKFPNDKLAQDAKAAISDLGKSNEEIIKEFEEKNKKKDSVKTTRSI